MKESGFRILGSKLGESDTFIDVTVDGIDSDGIVYFAEKGDKTKRTWNLKTSEVKRLTNSNFMVGASMVESHPLWDRAEQVGEDQSDMKTDYGVENLEKAQENIFFAAWYETR
jgi:hypothetical protein